MRYWVILTTCLLLSACGNDTMTEGDKKDYQAHKDNLASEERQKPLSFLSVTTNHRKNLLGNTVIKGTITNSATVCSYKAIRLKSLSFDASGKLLEEHEDEVEDIVQPNTDKDFKLRYHLPKDTDSVAVSIMSATVAE